jgi:hypothetical protein
MTESKVCAKCNGMGKRRHILGDMRECFYCHGAGSYPALDVKAIVDGITTNRGGKKFRKGKPPVDERKSVLESRIYYVWRMARFHGGADVTMPMTASFFIEGDPYIDDLNALADAVAKKAFGTDMAAAWRWGGLMGFTGGATPPKGLPDSAYEGGIVSDGNKPEDEWAELY